MSFFSPASNFCFSIMAIRQSSFPLKILSLGLLNWDSLTFGGMKDSRGFKLKVFRDAIVAKLPLLQTILEKAADLLNTLGSP